MSTHLYVSAASIFVGRRNILTSGREFRITRETENSSECIVEYQVQHRSDRDCISKVINQTRDRETTKRNCDHRNKTKEKS